jgi:DivIVA domain-containing protein
MKPEDIQGRDFLVGLRGYDKDEVRVFLAEVAAAHEAVLTELEAVRTAPAVETPAPVAPAPTETFEDLGASVAAILRTAQESATGITGEASSKAAELRDDAERYAEKLRKEAEVARDLAIDAAEGIKTQAAAELAEARAEAERIVREARETVKQIEIESEARMKNKADEVTRRENALRARLAEAHEELQLALVALGDDIAAPAVEVADDESVEHAATNGHALA